MLSEKNEQFIQLPFGLLEKKEMNLSEKLILAEAHLLSKNLGYCYASNAYLAKRLGLCPRTASASVSKLCRLGYIKTELLENNGRKIFVNFDRLERECIFFPGEEKPARGRANDSKANAKKSKPRANSSANYNNYYRNNYRNNICSEDEASYDIEELMKID